MFSTLIESGSHGRDLKRKTNFFLGTLAFYAVMLVAAGVGSIYAYDARLDAQNDQEIITLLRFPPARAATPRRDEPRPAADTPRGGSPRAATVPELVRIAPVTPNRQAARHDTPVLPPGLEYRIGPATDIPPASGGSPDGERGVGLRPSGGGLAPPRVEETETAPALPAPTPAVRATPQQPPAVARLSSSVLSGKAYHKPAPPYPELARKVQAAGPVAVQILLDEQGRVISAEATGGHPLLRQAAVRAAYQARFTPTLLGGRPVKVTGVITYNFVLQ